MQSVLRVKVNSCLVHCDGILLQGRTDISVDMLLIINLPAGRHVIYYWLLLKAARR
jgi:hypothetical protein